jgi:NADP-dependent 3-hydroxy acid dehydrogenase YdfG
MGLPHDSDSRTHTLANIADLKDKYSANALTLELDVTRPDQVKAAVKQAHDHFGRLDIILNNAGYSLVGTIEEASADEVRALYDTNIFGTLSVIQAALPLLRKQGGGHILGTSSGLGHVTMPLIGYYVPQNGRSRRFTKVWPSR